MPVVAVATDFSTRSDRAIRRAELLVEHSGYDLLIVHVIDDDQPQRLIDAEWTACEALLDEFQESITSRTGLTVRTALRTGEDFKEIPLAALEAEAELIVMGPHRRQVARSTFRGTTAERTIRHSTVPVLVANSPPASQYKRALFTAKLDPISATSIRRFESSPYLDSAERMLLHVYDSMDKEMLSRAMVPGDERADRLAQDRLIAAEALARFIEEHELTIDQPIVRESCGSFATDILNVASEKNADLVVVAPGSKNIFEAAILGRVSLAVLRQAECDALILPVG